MHFATGNYSTALEYFTTALDAPDLRSADRLRLLLRISDCHRERGQYDEAERFLHAARTLFSEDDDCDAGRLGYREAAMSFRRARYDAALKLGFAAYRRLKRSDEHQLVGDLQLLLANCYHRLGMLSEAEDYFNDALSTYRRIECQRGVAYVYNNLGLLHKMSCRWPRAIASLQRSLDIAVDLGMAQHVVLVHLNLGAVFLKTRQFAEAVSSLRAASEGAERTGDSLNLCRAVLMMGRANLRQSALARCEKYLMRGRAIADERGFVRELALADEFIGELMLARGRYHEAQINLLGALREGAKIAPGGDIVAECCTRLADVEMRLGNLDEAAAYIDRGLVAAQNSEHYELGFLYRVQARRLARIGKLEEALTALESSARAFEDIDDQFERGDTLQLTARYLVRTGDAACLSRARRTLDDSSAAFARADAPSKQVASAILAATVELRLGNVDDAMLVLCEADRLIEEDCCDRFRPALGALRRRIERSMTVASTRVVDRFSVLGHLHYACRSRDRLVEGLGSTLELILEKLDADSGFVAIPRNGDRRGLEVATRKGLKAKAARSLLSWYGRRNAGDDDAAASFVVTDIEARDSWGDLRDRLDPADGTVIFQPLGFDDEQLGVLCVHRRGDPDRGPLGQDALHFVAAYSSLISLSVFELVRCERRDRRRVRAESPAHGFARVVTENDDMIRLLGLAERVAHADATVLLQGETGTGKGLIAYAIHLLSERREHEFVHVNCAALPENLLESELFGHVRGSFTGAFANKTGLLQQADGGTIFLDKIGKTSLVMQGKLLQFLDNSMVRPVGSNDYVLVDVRVICASKANLQQLADEGRFLEDFYYRINDFPLVVPPLRDRREDIPLLAHHYIEKITRESGRNIEGATPAFLDRLQNYSWPGNVRELEKIIKRAIILADDGDTLDLQHLASEVVHDPSGRGAATATPPASEEELITLRERISRLEQAEISRTLDRSSGNKSRAASELGISYPNLLAKIKRYKIQ